MKKLLLLTTCTFALIGCSSSSNSDELDALSERVAELEELNNELTLENNAMKSEQTPTTTPDPTPEPTLESEPRWIDFNPKCSIERIDSVDSIWFKVTLTNPLQERSSFDALIDLYYRNNWISSQTTWLSNIPSGETLSEDDFASFAADGRSGNLNYYRCDVTEIDFR